MTRAEIAFGAARAEYLNLVAKFALALEQFAKGAADESDVARIEFHLTDAAHQLGECAQGVRRETQTLQRIASWT